MTALAIVPKEYMYFSFSSHFYSASSGTCITIKSHILQVVVHVLFIVNSQFHSSSTCIKLGFIMTVLVHVLTISF